MCFDGIIMNLKFIWFHLKCNYFEKVNVHHFLCGGVYYRLRFCGSRLLPPSIGENAIFHFSIFLEIVNCDLAQTFTIDSTHRHGGRVKISHVGNSCNSKKLGRKFFWFSPRFSRKRCGILRSVWTILRRSRGSTEWLKKSGISLKLFCQRAPNIFIGVFLKVHWRFSVDRTGAPLTPFGRGKVNP